MCKSVRTKGKIYAKVANAESANPFTQEYNWVCKLGIYHLCANFTLSLHVSKFEGNPFFRPVIQVHGNRERIIITCMQPRLVGGGVGEK